MQPQVGIGAAGSEEEDDIVGRAVRHTFSPADTARVLATCKAHVHGASVTQFLFAALALALTASLGRLARFSTSVRLRASETCRESGHADGAWSYTYLPCKRY